MFRNIEVVGKYLYKHNNHNEHKSVYRLRITKPNLIMETGDKIYKLWYGVMFLAITLDRYSIDSVGLSP